MLLLDILLPLVFGIGIGLLLGLVGGGGSILTVPVLVYILGEDVHQATVTSLVIVGVTALSGVVSHARAGRVVASTAILVGLAGVGGAVGGAYLNRQVSGPLILVFFGLLMLVTAARMTFVRPPAAGSISQQRPALDVPRAVLVGVLIGGLTGFFGVGGGFLIVPALVLLGFPMPLAVGTSLVIIVMNALAGLAARAGSIDIDVAVALLFILGGVVGSTLSSTLIHRVNDVALSRSFALLVALLGIALILENSVAAIQA